MMRSVLAYGLLIFLALPSVKAWQHVQDGHVEIRCKEDIPNHIHQAEYGCDFHKYHFSISLQAPVLQLEEATSPTPERIVPGFFTVPEREARRLFSLRAPPV